MQAVASTSGPASGLLTDANLRSHTAREGVAPRRTVQIYLEGIKNAGEYFVIPSDPVDDSESPATHPIAGPSHSRDLRLEPETKRRRLLDDADDEGFQSRDAALVMHRAAPGGKPSATTREVLEQSKRASLKKKPSLVSAMRPRLASVPNDSSSPRRNERNGTEAKEGKRKKDPDSRAPEVDTEKENHREGHQRDRTKVTKGKGKAIEPNESVVRRSDRGKGILRSEPENAQEAAELDERLEARRERRRNKAFIRKDRTQSAKATGEAAANKSNIVKKRGHDVEAPDSEEEGPSGKRGVKSKRGRQTAEQSGRELVQGLERSGAIGTGRLTLKSSTQLGLFNKGRASTRVKVGRADLRVEALTPSTFERSSQDRLVVLVLVQPLDRPSRSFPWTQDAFIEEEGGTELASSTPAGRSST
ncbi:hypothetical protein JCM11491_000098 [Sporobolomyces phaffii]